MTIDAQEMLARYIQDGYYKSPQPVTRERFQALLSEIAELFDPIDIRLGIRHPNLGRPKELHAHNECNHFADGIAWYCVDDGGASGSFYISPMAPVEARLDEEDLAHLEHAHVTLLRQRAPHTTVARWERGRPILLFPFGPCSFDERVPGRREAIERFYRVVRELTRANRLRGPDMALRTGEFILVDDRRYAHGRDALPPNTTRVLHRAYMHLRDRERWLRRTVDERPFGAQFPRAAGGGAP